MDQPSNPRPSRPPSRRTSARPPAPRGLERGEFHTFAPPELPGLLHLVRVYLPRGYGRGGKHPVLVLFDGQNVFGDQGSYAGGWHAHEAVDRLATLTRLAPVIVAIDHGGERRIVELSPFETQAGHGALDGQLDWICASLLPTLRGRYELVAGPQGVVVGGSSMGGLAAMYAHFRRPEAFGGALVMSPSFWVGRGRIQDFVASQPVPWTSKVYLDCGAKEGGGRMLQSAERMAAMLRHRGYGADRLWFRADPRGTHSEVHWRRRLPRALRFLFV